MNLVRLISEPSPNVAAAPMLVLLHGLGSNEEDLMGLAPQLDPSLRVVALRAPSAYGMGGFAWFPIIWDAAGIKVNVWEIERTRDLLLDELESLQAEYAPRKFVLGGFSQGAIMTLAAGLWAPELFSGLLLMSGRNVADLFTRASPAIAGKPCLVQHGTYDDVLPVGGAWAMRDALLKRGAIVEHHDYPMGHTISHESLRDARAWLDRVAGEG